MKLNQINEVVIPAIVIKPAIAAFLKKYGSKIATVVAVAVIEKLIVKLVKKFYINKQDNLPSDLFYMGFGYSTKVPRNEFSHTESIGGMLRKELESKIPTDFSLYQASDMTSMIGVKKPDSVDKDIYIMNSFLLGFKVKPNMKDLSAKIITGFKKLNIEIKITYYGKK